jgi:hypothetical protein
MRCVVKNKCKLKNVSPKNKNTLKENKKEQRIERS